MTWHQSWLFAAALCSLSAGVAGAEDHQDAKHVPVEPGLPLFQFIKSHPECVSFTDGCVICLRNGTELNCSIEGIACQPGRPECTSMTAPAE